MSDLVALVIARLDAEVPALRSVAGAVDFAELVERGQRPQRLPAAFVMWLGDDAERNELLGTGDRVQALTETIGVVLVHQDRGDATGDKAREKLVPLVDAVRGALAGWAPSADHDAIDYRRGRLQGLTAGAVWQQLDFETRSELAA